MMTPLFVENPLALQRETGVIDVGGKGRRDMGQEEETAGDAFTGSGFDPMQIRSDSSSRL